MDITRNICNGISVTFHLTEEERYQAYLEQKEIFDRKDIQKLMEETLSDEEFSKYHDEEIISTVQRCKEKYLSYGCSSWDAETNAVYDVIEELRLRDFIPMRQDIRVRKTEIKFINELLHMTGNQIYDKYGFKGDKTISYTAKFGKGFEMDIELVICEGDSTPYTKATLYHNGGEVAFTEPGSEFTGTWMLKDDCPLNNLGECKSLSFVVRVLAEG